MNLLRFSHYSVGDFIVNNVSLSITSLNCLMQSCCQLQQCMTVCGMIVCPCHYAIADLPIGALYCVCVVSHAIDFLMLLCVVYIILRFLCESSACLLSSIRRRRGFVVITTRILVRIPTGHAVLT